MKNFGGRCLLLVIAANLYFLPASYGQNATETPQTKAAEPSAKELPQPMAYDKAFPIAKGYADMFLNGTGGELWDKMTREMQQALGNDRTKWEVMAGGTGQQIGKVTETVNERMLPALQLQVYTRLIRTDAFPGRLMVTIALTSDGKITGLSGRPEGNPAESKFLEYKDKNTYRFPLTGEWTIFQGGRSVYDNYHAAAAGRAVRLRHRCIPRWQHVQGWRDVTGDVLRIWATGGGGSGGESRVRRGQIRR